jgi:hypothetical protein
VAHSFLKITLLVGSLLSLTAQSGNCQQNYNYRYGNSRVVQGAGGLPNPASSYITGGTLSHSAQIGAGVASPYSNLPSGSSSAAIQGAGMTPGISGNTGLQSARMGSTVGMPGDYMRSDLNPNFSYQQQQQPRQYQRRQVRYQQQQPSNQVATYGAPYQRNSSMPTGRQATQVQTILPNQQSAAAPAPAGGGGASTAANTGAAAAGDYKGY